MVFLIYSQSRKPKKSWFKFFSIIVFWCLHVMNFLCWFIDEWRIICDILISIKAAHQETLGFYMFHCLNLSKHISISILFFIISVSCFVLFCWIFERNCSGSGFPTFFVPGVGNSPFQNIPHGFVPRGEDGQAWN